MIDAYLSNGSMMSLSADKPEEGCPDGVVWLDLVRPKPDEDRYVERLLGIDIPTRDELKDIEPSSRLYLENGAIYMTASLVWKADSRDAQLADVAFILTDEKLVTVRYADPKSFSLFIAAIGRVPEDACNGATVLAHLLETIADRTAEILEMVIARVDQLSADIFRDRGTRRPPKFLEGKLAEIAECHRLVGKVRDSLGSLSRLLTFLLNAPSVQNDENVRNLCTTVSRDVTTLSEHASFVAGNIAFLLDASLGLINVEQNAIIKIFSIASVVFLPPTLVASIYGMNFQLMPELNWNFGYPMALCAMLISAIVPFFIFRWKGWL